jgi:hypothetical protein
MSRRLKPICLAFACAIPAIGQAISAEGSGNPRRTVAAVEGATHLFQPCRPAFGDTEGRTFDFVDSWLSKTGRL